ncbi:MAG: phage holin family protein [Desulforhabdus sp.]|jgi:putative membrane protein|nr:phage holin family protein [Desulforhabdus sp.]
MAFLLNILVLSVAIFAVAQLLPAIHIRGFGTAVIVAVVYSVINFLLGWLFFILSLPFIILTFGLFKFVINAVLLWITDKVVDGFKIDGFGWTLVAAFLIALLDTVIRWVIY